MTNRKRRGRRLMLFAAIASLTAMTSLGFSVVRGPRRQKEADRFMRLPIKDPSSHRVIRSSVPGIKVEEIRRITLNGQPFVEATLRNVSRVPMTYVRIEHGGSFTEVSFLQGEYLAAQDTIVQRFDAQAESEVVIAAGVYADGNAEGEALAVMKAAFYHDEFLAATERYLAAVASARAEYRSDKAVVGQLLAQSDRESKQKEHRTKGALALSHFLTRTFNSDDGDNETEKLNNLVQHLQRVHSNTRATGKERK